MTLVDETLNILQGPLATADIEFINQDESSDAAGRSAEFDLTRNSAILASRQAGETTRHGAKGHRVEDVVEVTFRGLHESEYGDVTSLQLFESASAVAREAIRSADPPSIVAGRSETWVELRQENETPANWTTDDHYQTTFDCRWIGHDDY